MKSALSSQFSASVQSGTQTCAISPLVRLLLAVLMFLRLPCSADVLKIAVNDAIQPVTAEYIGRALDLAAANHDQAVLIEMNTPGGLVDSTREIIDKIVASPVPVIVYVTPAAAVPDRPESSSSKPLTSRPWRREPTPGRHIP